MLQRKTGKLGLSGLFCALGFLMTAMPAVHAAVVANYPFTNNSLSSTDKSKNSTSSDIALGSGLTDTNRFTANGNPGAALLVNADETAGNLNGSIMAGDYFTLTLAPKSGYQLAFTDFTVDLAVTNMALTTNVQLQASLDGGTTYTDVASIIGFNSTTFTTQTFDLSAFAAITSPVILRATVYDSGNGKNSTEFDNIVVDGTLTAVPEPGSVALLSLGAVAAGGAILRRRKK